MGATHAPTVAPRLYGNARIAYHFDSPYPSVALAGHYLAKRPSTGAFDRGFGDLPYAPAQLELRATVSGPVPVLVGLSYRASFDWALAGETPYIVGPTQASMSAISHWKDADWAAMGATPNAPAFAPVDRFRSTFGLAYELLP